MWVAKEEENMRVCGLLLIVECCQCVCVCVCALNSIILIFIYVRAVVRPRTFLRGTSKGGDAEEIYVDDAQLNDSARSYSCTYARMIEHVCKLSGGVRLCRGYERNTDPWQMYADSIV
jgi:hypothetical protein